MLLTSLRVHDFRSYSQVCLTPPGGVTVLVGPNGVGKTNLLEAVHLCCLGRSHRTGNDHDMIAYGQETAAVQLTVQRNDGEHQVGVRLYENNRRKKIIYVNGKTMPRIGELIGHATCVIFSPEDLHLIREGPQIRRRFLDMLLSQDNRNYFYALQQYSAALKQRNALLRSLQFSGNQSQLDAWDEQLARTADPVIRLRREAVEKLDRFSARHYSDIAGREDERFRMHYISQLAEASNPGEALLRLLKSSRAEDLRRFTTQCGPHRDDLSLILSDREIRSYGSQGQVRTAALSMKLASFDLLRSSLGEPPLLLLDDVLSELDGTRRERLIASVAGAQALLTCTDMSDLMDARPACVLQVSEGELKQL